MLLVFLLLPTTFIFRKLQGENEHMRDANEELQKLLVHHKQEVDKEAKVNKNASTLNSNLDI